MELGCTNKSHQIGLSPESMSVVDPTLNLPVAYISDDFYFSPVLINTKDDSLLNPEIRKVNKMSKKYEEFYGIVYCTTNLINGKIYVGQTIHNNPDYLGSGKLIGRAIDKYGRINFKKKILCICFNRKELSEAEKFLIKEYQSTNLKIGYNITLGGECGDTFTNNPDKERLREQHRKNALEGKTLTSNVKGKTKKHLEKIRLANIGNISKKRGKTYEEIYGYKAEEERRKRIESLNTSEYKEKHSKVIKKLWENMSDIDKKKRGQKISENKKGKTSKLKGRTYEEIFGVEKAKEIKEKHSKGLKGKISYRKGKTYEDVYGEKAKEISLKISLANKGKKRKPMKEETKRKISEKNKNCVPWNKGLTKENTPKLAKSEEAREKISNKLKNNKNSCKIKES